MVMPFLYTISSSCTRRNLSLPRMSTRYTYEPVIAAINTSSWEIVPIMHLPVNELVHMLYVHVSFIWPFAAYRKSNILVMHQVTITRPEMESPWSKDDKHLLKKMVRSRSCGMRKKKKISSCCRLFLCGVH